MSSASTAKLWDSNLKTKAPRGNPTLEVSIQLHATDRPTNNQHPGRYHLPTAPEISVLMPGEIRENQSHSIVCSMRHQDDGRFPLRTFSDFHRSYDPLQCPLLFPLELMDGPSTSHPMVLETKKFHWKNVFASPQCRERMISHTSTK